MSLSLLHVQYYKNVNLCPVQHTVKVKYALVIVHVQTHYQF